MIGLVIGVLFGAGLILGGLADPDKIVGTLRLKDLHGLRTIILFVLVGMLGTWILELAGAAHLDVKPAAIVAVALGGALLGIGFGLTGYCPGTGLACAAAGRLDALVTLVGMLVGAFVFILIYPSIVQPIDAIANFKKVTLPQITGIARGYWVVPIVVVGVAALFVTRKK
jgi:hypothetical protein